MVKQFVVLILSVCILSSVSAQESGVRRESSLSFMVAGAENRGTMALSYLHDWRLGRNGKLAIGVGGRLTAFVGSNLQYRTAPAELTTGDTGPLVIFKPDLPENIDSLLIKSSQVNAFNVMVNISYPLGKKFIAGFNIDALGFSFGGKRNVVYMNGQNITATTARPTRYNLLLISDNDRGSLNSELYLRYTRNESWNFVVAAQFIFTEYTTTEAVQQFPEENDRFRNKSLLFAAGVSYRLKSRRQELRSTSPTCLLKVSRNL